MIPLLIFTALTGVFLSPEYGEPGLGGCTAVIDTDSLTITWSPDTGNLDLVPVCGSSSSLELSSWFFLLGMNDSSVVMSREICHDLKMSSIRLRLFSSIDLSDIGPQDPGMEIVVPRFPRFQYVSPDLERLVLLYGLGESAVLVVYDLITGEYLSEIRPGSGMDDPLLLLRSIDWTGEDPVLRTPDPLDGSSD